MTKIKRLPLVIKKLVQYYLKKNQSMERIYLLKLKLFLKKQNYKIKKNQIMKV